MYVEIKNNQLLSWCKDSYLDYQFVDIDYATFDSAKYSVIDGVLTDISTTQDYLDKIAQKEKTTKIANFQLQIDDIDKKRIRAICEPSIKDETTGQTWLEYYNLQVQDLRTQITNLG